LCQLSFLGIVPLLVLELVLVLVLEFF
jgi:hypothetical protein